MAAVYLLLVLWGPTHALRTWWGVLLLGALLAAGLVVIRRQCLAEFPDAGFEVLPSLRSRVAESVRSARTSPSETSAVRTLSDELERLAALRDRGVISAEEFEVAKRVALSAARPRVWCRPGDDDLEAAPSGRPARGSRPGRAHRSAHRRGRSRRRRPRSSPAPPSPDGTTTMLTDEALACLTTFVSASCTIR